MKAKDVIKMIYELPLEADDADFWLEYRIERKPTWAICSEWLKPRTISDVNSIDSQPESEHLSYSLQRVAELISYERAKNGNLCEDELWILLTKVNELIENFLETHPFPDDRSKAYCDPIKYLIMSFIYAGV